MSRAYLALGTNIGNLEENLIRALDKIRENGCIIERQSSFIKTRPYGYVEQPDFLNCVIEISTDKTPFELLDTVMKIENDMGRVRKEKWGPRIIDIDILFFDDLVIETENLIIPHPDLHNRLFVLEPLNEIAPGLIHPVIKKSIQYILDSCRKLFTIG
jgi:dihydroneopterin aldolase / 2-amino-4-hydroxy-6-hydroxymethyldihydropteridine diphosphokinase